MKIELEYDPISQQLSEPDINNSMIVTWTGLERFESKGSALPPVAATELIKLRDAGYSVSDISALRQEGLL